MVKPAASVSLVTDGWVMTGSTVTVAFFSHLSSAALVEQIGVQRHTRLFTGKGKAAGLVVEGQNLRIDGIAGHIGGDLIHQRSHRFVIVGSGGGQVHALLPKGQRRVDPLTEGRLLGGLNLHRIGAADGISLFQHVAQIPGGRHVGRIEIPRFIPDSDRDGKLPRRLPRGLRQRFPGFLHRHAAHADPVHKYAGINHVLGHVIFILPVGRGGPAVIAQQFAVDEGVISKVLPEISRHLGHHHHAQHTHAEKAQGNDEHIQEILPRLRFSAPAAILTLRRFPPSRFRAAVWLSLRRPASRPASNREGPDGRTPVQIVVEKELLFFLLIGRK